MHVQHVLYFLNYVDNYMDLIVFNLFTCVRTAFIDLLNFLILVISMCENVKQPCVFVSATLAATIYRKSYVVKLG